LFEKLIRARDSSTIALQLVEIEGRLRFGRRLVAVSDGREHAPEVQPGCGAVAFGSARGGHAPRA
jgi:hypothetical protein